METANASKGTSACEKAVPTVDCRAMLEGIPEGTLDEATIEGVLRNLKIVGADVVGRVKASLDYAACQNFGNPTKNDLKAALYPFSPNVQKTLKSASGTTSL